MSKTKHERTVEIQKSLENRLKFPISYFDSRQYVQHNLALEDGLGPILALMDALPADRTKVQPLRSFEDGDYSIAHLSYELGDWGPMVGFEVHRWQADRIVEHWDNLQSTPTSANRSGRSMTEGASLVTDLAKTDSNKELIERFTRTFLIGGNYDSAADYFERGALIQHSSLCGDGTAELTDALTSARGNGAGPEYRHLHKLLGQGNMVLAISEGTLTDEEGTKSPVAFYDLYRLEHDAIAEHWDVIQVIPPREAWKNQNGKF